MLSAASRPFVKICGLTSAADAAVCAEAGASAIGINFYPKSKRFHPLPAARTWLRDFAGGPARVALFVNAALTEIREAADTALFEAIQLHGDESPDFCAAVRALGLPVIRGLALRSAEDIALLENHPADAFILDAYAPGDYGGTGRLSDWPLAAEAVRRFPDKTLLLSGGLAPDNVAAAVREVQPFGVDVASGVESAPGVKDHHLIRDFIAAARAVSL
jgi:phosphoribosylanthranilate isomerase